jgi:predicted dienelactone hydrolase
MLGVIIIFILVVIELVFMVYCLRTKSEQRKVKHVIRLCEFALFCLLVMVRVVEFNFRWYMLFIILLIQAITGAVFLVKKPESIKVFKKKYAVLSCINRCMLLVFAIIPSFLFPQFENIEPCGNYSVATESYTLTDADRIETYSNDGDNRKITVQFWYPDTESENNKYPLVIFSHGAFGFRGSNYSTFMELASNGYVVCSVDHTYQSFFSKQTDGKTVIVNNDFINDAIAVQNGDYDDEKTYKLTHEWLKLRTDDINFVLETILNNQNDEYVYKIIDAEKIGLSGHSLGGATSAELGRMRKDIDAVIVIDGTMIGEEIDFADGKSVLNNEAYPVPILNIYNDEHYNEALLNSSNYANMVASKNALDSHDVVFKESGHLNFTDLPLFSPFLAKMLGTGNIDKVYCIEKMNNVVLDFFNYYLKDGKELNIMTEY